MTAARGETGSPAPHPSIARNAFDRFFEISARGSTLAREIRGGLATFLPMAYVVVLTPLIVGNAVDGDGNRLSIPALAAATALVAGAMTILMGVVARFPLALAAGLGINALVAYEIAPQMTWADAMGLVVIEGVIITLLVLTGLRKAVFDAVPTELKTAIAAGIGLFLVLIGLVDAGIVRRQPSGTVPVGLGVNGRLIGWPILVFVFALVVTLILLVRRVKGAILIGIISAAVLAIVVETVAKIGPSFTPPDQVNPTGWSLNVPAVPAAGDLFGLPDLSLLGKFNVLGSWQTAGWL